MKSRTSFFNGTVLKKDITRFAPVWALYTVFLIILFLSGQREDPTLSANAIANLLSEMAIFSLIYGGLCANILFGDLFQSRMCNALHALPITRESWFATHALAGLLFCIVPSVVGAIFLMAFVQQFYYMALLWLAVTVLQFLFFFGLGIFSTMCAGNRLGMAAVYMIINLFSLLVYVLAKEVYEPLLYGIELVQDPFQFFCPVAHLTAENLLSFDYDHINGHFVNGHIGEFYPEVWAYLFTVAAIGIALGFLALLLYRKRKLECAGDFVAFRGLAPVFLLICTLACGVFLYALSSVFGFAVDYILMAIGVIVGFFAGLMLLERTVRVFSKKNFLRFAVLAVALTVSLVLTKLDPLRITWYVPEANEIASMQVYSDGRFHAYRRGEDTYQLDSAEEIDTFRQVHSVLMSERGEKTDGASHMYIHYKLNSGREVIRYYTIDEHTAAYETLRMYFSDYRYIFDTDNWNEITSSISSIDVSLSDRYYGSTEKGEPVAITMESQSVTDPAKITQLLEAIHKDCDEGNMAQSYTFHVDEEYLGWLYLSSNVHDDKGIIIHNGNIFRDVNIYPSAVHTKAVLVQWLADTSTQ